MKVVPTLITILFLCFGCEKNVKDEDVFSNLVLTPKQVLADGQSTINVSVQINDKASADRRNFVFATTAGTFTVSGSSQYTGKAEYENGVLLAKATLRSPIVPGEFTVRVQPEFDSPVRDFLLSGTVVATVSTASSLHLQTSGFGIVSNFGSEVLLTALLKNAGGSNVSKGTPVLFEDELPNGSAAGGRYRNRQAATGDSSKVTTYYSAAAHPIGTTLKIRTTLLDATGQKTAVKDSVFITINL